MGLIHADQFCVCIARISMIRPTSMASLQLRTGRYGKCPIHSVFHVFLDFLPGLVFWKTSEQRNEHCTVFVTKRETVADLDFGFSQEYSAVPGDIKPTDTTCKDVRLKALDRDERK